MKIQFTLLSLFTAGLILTAWSPARSGKLSLAQSTVTPTPFLPTFASVEFTQDQAVSGSMEDELWVPDFGVFAPPSEASDIAIPLPMATFSQPKGDRNIGGFAWRGK